MDKKEIEKNRLDLAYRRQLHFLNFILLIGVGSIISLVISLVVNFENWFRYAIAFVVVAVITFIIYNRIDENLQKISNKIQKL